MKPANSCHSCLVKAGERNRHWRALQLPLGQRPTFPDIQNCACNRQLSKSIRGKMPTTRRAVVAVIVRDRFGTNSPLTNFGRQKRRSRRSFFCVEKVGENPPTRKNIPKMPGVLASNLAISDMMKRKAGITSRPRSARTRRVSPVRKLGIARVMSVMGILTQVFTLKWSTGN